MESTIIEKVHFNGDCVFAGCCHFFGVFCFDYFKLCIKIITIGIYKTHERMYKYLHITIFDRYLDYHLGIGILYAYYGIIRKCT